VRIQPCRTLSNVIEGVVISFVEISELKKTQEALQQHRAAGRLAIVVRDSRDPMTVQDLEGRILAWNPAAERIYGWSEAEALKMNGSERIPAELRQEGAARLEKLGRAGTLKPYRTHRLAKDGSVVQVSLIATGLFDAAGKMYAIAATERLQQTTSKEKELP